MGASSSSRIKYPAEELAPMGRSCESDNSFSECRSFPGHASLGLEL